jgi:hypothetical protein
MNAVSQAIEPGSVVGLVYAQPGNDVTYLLVLRIEGDKAIMWDVAFGIEVSCNVDRLWAATERELDSTISFGPGTGRTGSYTIRQLADEARARA